MASSAGVAAPPYRGLAALSSSSPENVESLAEEFLERLRRGESPSVHEYVERYPHLAHEIRDFFPTLRLVEHFKPESRDEPASGRQVESSQRRAELDSHVSVSPKSVSIESLAEEYLERLRRGENPSADEYAARYPWFAEEIRQFLPALELVDNFKPDSQDRPSAPRPAGPGFAADSPTPVPTRLGDYHILREVGRGGMAIVYEAV